jgi:hypothetical protein
LQLNCKVSLLTVLALSHCIDRPNSIAVLSCVEGRMQIKIVLLLLLTLAVNIKQLNISIQIFV